MSDNKPTINVAIPTPLFLIFLVLKLTGLIDWSWWLVTAPLWLPLLLVCIVLGVVFLIGLVVVLFERKK